MARNQIPRFTNVLKNYAVQITANSSLNTLFTSSTGGSRLSMLSITTTNSAALTVDLKLINTAVATYSIGQIAVAAGAGTTSTAAIDGLNATELPFVNVDAHGNTFIDVMEGWKIGGIAASLSTADSRVVTLSATVYDHESD